VLSNVIIVVVSVSAAVVFLYVVKFTSAEPSRERSNAFTGAVVAVIGTTYAVLLAFMLGGVWNMLREAQANAEQEATSVINIYRIAAQIKTDDAGQIQEVCLRYAQNVVDREFPALEQRGPLSKEGGQMINQLWKLLEQSKVRSETDSIALGQMMQELRSLTEHRRLRALQSREGLPAILWAVLIAGGAITVVASCLFGVSSFRFQLVEVLALSFLISLVLVAIADIDKPYQGPVRVDSAGFRYAIRTLQNESSP
jgi:hypothetical protein